VNFRWKLAVVALLILLSASLPANGQFLRGRLILRRATPCVPVCPPEFAFPIMPTAPLVPMAEAKRPDPLVPPAGNVFLFSYRASGVQIYQCQPKKADAESFEWVLKGPDAALFNDKGDKVGEHTAGPAWEVKGSKITASKMAGADAPAGKAIPWLLLKVESRAGEGVFDRVTFIQRVDTQGGLPPEAALKENAGQVVKVKYEAVYRFYGSK
jgi:hypothetical protein